MVHRYSVSLYDEEIYQDDDGTFVYYFDYADLEQRFDALSTKFSAMVEENATLKKRLEPIYKWFESESDDGMELYDICLNIWELKEGE